MTIDIVIGIFIGILIAFIVVRFPGWQDTKAGERAVQKPMRKVIYFKYKIKDQDLFQKAFGYIRRYY